MSCVLKKTVQYKDFLSQQIVDIAHFYIFDLGESGPEITSSNRPKDVFFDWFLNPFLVMKDQIKAENLTEAEEDYLCKLVLFCGDHERLKLSGCVSPESERKRAELDGLARR